MKLKIKVKRINKQIELPKLTPNGDWIDLRASKSYVLTGPIKYDEAGNIGFESKLINLGIAMQLPEGFEAHVLPRSSTYKNFSVILTNSQGIIDNSYCGNKDEWKFGALAFKDTAIKAGDRICQFRIMLSQKATVWQKLKWLFSSGIEIVEVDSLSDNNRGGIGSTGIK